MSCHFFTRDKCFKCPAVTAVLFKWRRRGRVALDDEANQHIIEDMMKRVSHCRCYLIYSEYTRPKSEKSASIEIIWASMYLATLDIIISAFIRKNNNEWRSATVGWCQFALIISFNCFLFGFIYLLDLHIFILFGFTFFFLMDFFIFDCVFSSPGGLSAIASSFVARWRNYH